MERVRRNGTNMLENLEMACLMEMEHIFPMMEAGRYDELFYSENDSMLLSFYHI